MGLRVLVVSTYEMGRQPFGLASPAAWLAEAGCEVDCLDLAVEPFNEQAAAAADLVAFFVPMHLATRLAVEALGRVRRLNPRAHTCFYGLYAPVNADYLRGLGVDTVLGGEFEEGLVRLARSVAGGRAAEPTPSVSTSRERQAFRVPRRSGLPPLERYGALVTASGERRAAGYTEASRGCKHRCRHCPVVPVYDGRFRIVQRDVILADIRQQVAAGARHITFGDPDFFNGIGHALPLLEALHEEHPELSYDVTIKVEHLLRHREHLPTLRRTGCVLVTSAVEAFDAGVLRRLEKGHTPADAETAVRLCREAGLHLAPTFVAFTPWTTPESYLHFLSEVARLGLVDAVAPVQYTLRLLITPGSRLLELDEIAELAGPLEAEALVHPWRHPDPRMDDLQREVEGVVLGSTRAGEDRRRIFARVWEHAAAAAGAAAAASDGPAVRQTVPVRRSRSGDAAHGAPDLPVLADRVTVPYLTEPWYC